MGMLSVLEDFIVFVSLDLMEPRSLVSNGLKKGRQAHMTPRRTSRDVRSAIRQYMSELFFFAG